MVDAFNSIKAPAEGTFKEKGSKFLAFAFPVKNDVEIQEALDEIKAKYHDARHHCYAWRLGPEGVEYRANDDGEPSHSAGTPIYNEIRSRELYDVLVVVVRYFGGTKLGIPGLIEAYGTSAAEALDAAQTVKIVLREPVFIRFPYDQTAEVGRVIQRFKLKPKDSTYGADCWQKFDVRLRDLQQVMDVFEEMGILSKD